MDGDRESKRPAAISAPAGQADLEPIAGTDEASRPFFFADGKTAWLHSTAEHSKLKVVDIATAPPRRLPLDTRARLAARPSRRMIRSCSPTRCRGENTG
jgi:hypothetical protein